MCPPPVLILPQESGEGLPSGILPKGPVPTICLGLPRRREGLKGWHSSGDTTGSIPVSPCFSGGPHRVTVAASPRDAFTAHSLPPTGAFGGPSSEFTTSPQYPMSYGQRRPNILSSAVPQPLGLRTFSRLPFSSPSTISARFPSWAFLPLRAEFHFVISFPIFLTCVCFSLASPEGVPSASQFSIFRKLNRPR